MANIAFPRADPPLPLCPDCGYQRLVYAEARGTLNCTRCGYERECDWTKCRRCGAIKIEDEVCKKCGFPPNARCVTCGTITAFVYDPGATVFCSACKEKKPAVQPARFLPLPTTRTEVADAINTAHPTDTVPDEAETARIGQLLALADSFGLYIPPAMEAWYGRGVDALRVRFDMDAIKKPVQEKEKARSDYVQYQYRWQRNPKGRAT